MLCLCWGGACKKRSESRPSPNTEETPETFPRPQTKKADLQLQSKSSLQGLGLPAICKPELPIVSAKVHPKTRFFGNAEELDVLALASPQKSGKNVQSSLFKGNGSKLVALPWRRLEAPPLLARSSLGYRFVSTEPTPPGKHRRLVWWKEKGAGQQIAQGESLEAIDLHCSGKRCTLLTSRISRVSGPGATLISLGAENGQEIERREIHHDAHPFALAAMASRSRGILRGRNAVLLRGLDKSNDRKIPLSKDLRLYEAVESPSDLFLFSAGRPETQACSTPGFPVTVIALSQPSQHKRFLASAPPRGLVARATSFGLLAAWIAAPNCRLAKPRVLYTQVLDATGIPAGRPFAVGPAEGFFLAAQKNRITLWVLRPGGHLARLNATCSQASQQPSKGTNTKPGATNKPAHSPQKSTRSTPSD